MSKGSYDQDNNSCIKVVVTCYMLWRREQLNREIEEKNKGVFYLMNDKTINTEIIF